MANNGYDKGTISEVSRALNVSRCAIRENWARFCKFGDVKHAKGAGRPMATSPRTDRYFERTCKQNRLASAHDIEVLCSAPSAQKISARTVQRRLETAGYKSAFAARKPLLRREGARGRKNGVFSNGNFTETIWIVLFSQMNPILKW